MARATEQFSIPTDMTRIQCIVACKNIVRLVRAGARHVTMDMAEAYAARAGELGRPPPVPESVKRYADPLTLMRLRAQHPGWRRHLAKQALVAAND